MLQVVVIDVGDTLGNFRARDATVQIKHLGSDLLENIGTTLDAHQLIIELVSTSDYLDIIEIMSVDGGKADTAVVHLAGEYLVAEEVMSENTAVTVRTEDAFVTSDIRKVANHGMHGVVLLLHIVQMACIPLNIVAAENSLEQQEGIEILMFP